ncbi:hypothetical protein AC1031_004872 [Aphanomyces cochlioides]|nr:hypothetical protein AC1031_004872 [Aphanomyces cochlioides]
MAEDKWLKLKSMFGSLDGLGQEKTIEMFDNEEKTTGDDEDDEESEDAMKSFFDLFNERKFLRIQKRLENISDEELAAIDPAGLTILDYAAISKNLDLVARIIEQTNYKIIPNYLCSPLLQATKHMAVDIVEFFIKAFHSSLDFIFVDSEGDTCLNIAARNSCNQIVELLLKAGADPNVENNTGQTPLTSAVIGWNVRGVEILLNSGAEIDHRCHEGKTALYVASSQGFEDAITALLKAGAEIDIKDTSVERYIVQVAKYPGIQKKLQTERISRALYPVHTMVRQGNLKALQNWFSSEAVKGPGLFQIWRGHFLSEGQEFEIKMPIKLCREAPTRTYQCTGIFEDEGGVYQVNGEWGDKALNVMKSYTNSEKTIEFKGFVNMEAAEWKGTCTSSDGSTNGEFLFKVPLFACSKCQSKIPEDGIVCFTCSALEAHRWNGQYQDEDEWFGLSLCVEVIEDVAANLYRLNGSGHGNNGEVYKLSGIWKDGRIVAAKHYTSGTEMYEGNFDQETKVWSGELINSRGSTFPFHFVIDMWPCTECGVDVPNENAKCFNCQKGNNYNWKGETCQDGEWKATGLFIVVTRDADHGCYRLVGEGTDDIDSFDAFGTWEGNDIKMTKVYAHHLSEFKGTFDKDTKVWSGTWTVLEEATGEFRITIPSYACYKCEGLVPVQNELCLNCSVDVPEWNPLNGSLLRAWVGQCRLETGDWTDDEFCVNVLRDLATDSYRFAGFDKDGAGYFASSGVWKDDSIHMERIYPDMKAVMDGKYDPVKSEWSGPNILEYDSGYKNNGKMRYTVPMWPCVQCSKLVPIEDALCFTCDKTPRDSVQPLNLPFEVESIRSQIKARIHISQILNERDRNGRTVLMYAAENAHLNILEEMLPFISPDDIRTNDNDCKSALDLALARKLVCSDNSYQITNDELLNCIEVIRRRSCLRINPFTIPKNFALNQKCCGDCTQAVQATAKKDSALKLYDLAKSKHWEDLEDLLSEPIKGEILNARQEDTGSTVVHLVCRDGKVKILKLLLEQPELDLNIANNANKYPLYEAVKKDRVGCVQLLLHAGVAPYLMDAYEAHEDQISQLNKNAKCYQMIVNKYTLMQQDRLNLYYQANVPSIQVAERHIRSNQSALHAAVLHRQSSTIVDALSQDELIDVDQQDENGNTALMLAARGTSKLSEEYVQILISREADVDVKNKDSRTALMIAAVAGNVNIVELLLNQMAEIDIQDKDGKTCLDLVKELNNAPTIASETKHVTPHAKIKSLLTIETQTRANSVEFRDKLAKALVRMTLEEAFLQGGFRKAINCSPKLARSFLDDCVVITRHDVQFSQLKQIYGEEVKTSALNSTLNLKSDDEDYIMEARKECLEHVVMRRVMEIKWELFGQRKYLEQFMMNMLLLVTSTISSIMFDGDPMTSVSSGFLISGIAAIVLTIVGCIFVQFLRPQLLWRISRLIYDGKLTNVPQLEIPNLPEKKRHARMLLICLAVFLTIVLVIPILHLMDLVDVDQYFPIFNHCVLWLTAAYFLMNEIQEARAGLFKYFKSDVNKAQMAIYLVIFFVFVPLKLNIVKFGMLPDSKMAVEIGIGTFISIMLWVLTVQFLEVVPSASYLLPMMSNLLQDVWNFFIFFGVFQMGLTITFYQLFKRTDDESFHTITQSFITTYFVAFGQLPLDSLKAFGESEDGQRGRNDFLAACAVVLMMFHAAVVVILLLNMLLAMMNKTFEVGFEKAKTEALASYAKCILRLEESMNHTKDDTVALIHLKDANGDLVLNPIFDEIVPKPLLQISDELEASIDAYQKKKTEWMELIDELHSAALEELQGIENGLLHTQHFVKFDVTDALKVELSMIRRIRERLVEYVAVAKKTRGQDPENALKKLDGLVKKDFTKFEDYMKRVWYSKKKSIQQKQCVLLHQMTRRHKFDQLMSTLKKNIIARYEAILNREKEKVVADPTLSDVMERFDSVEQTVRDQISSHDTSGNDDLAEKLAVVTQQNEDLTKKIEEMATKFDEELSKQREEMTEKLDKLMQLMLEMKS